MTGLTDAAIAVLLGGGVGVGAWCIAAAMPAWRTPALVRRIGPYVRDVTDPAGTTLSDAITDPTVALAGGIGAVWRRAQARFTRLLGAAESLELRLAQAGRSPDVAAFRGAQLTWGIVGAIAVNDPGVGLGFGCAALIALIAAGRVSVAAFALPLIAAAAGVVARDLLLSSQARSRVARIEEELPTVLEFLALCLSAGEGVLGSVRRVADVGTGELTAELRAATVEVDTGATLTDALTAMTRRIRAPLLTRAIDHAVAAIERGSPLADTLEAQASDAREDAKRTLIEAAGRKEILMMIPLVFGLLPLSVLFAIFPGIAILQQGF